MIKIDNATPENTIKIFWHIALIAAFLMVVVFLIDLAKFFFGIP